MLGETDRARLGDALQTRGDIDALAHQVAVGLLDDVAKMDADAELDAAIVRQADIALDHAGLKLDRAAHRVDHASKFGEEPVAGALDDAPAVHGDGGIDQIAAQALRRDSVRSSSAAARRLKSNDIGDQDRSDLSVFGHTVRSRALESSTNGELRSGLEMFDAIQTDD